MTDEASQGNIAGDAHAPRDFAEGQEHKPADEA